MATAKMIHPEIVKTAFALLDTPHGRLRLPHVLAILQIGKSSLYEGVARGILPPPQRISAKSVAWNARDIKAVVEGTYAREAA